MKMVIAIVQNASVPLPLKLMESFNRQDEYRSAAYLYFYGIRDIRIGVATHRRNRCDHLITARAI